MQAFRATFTPFKPTEKGFVLDYEHQQSVTVIQVLKHGPEPTAVYVTDEGRLDEGKLEQFTDCQLGQPPTGPIDMS